jgi:putative PIN family toxin of toxin-antitoxin system
MTVVIDCNVLVMCLTSRSPYHVIYKSLVAGKFELTVSEDIVLEYEEIVQEKYGLTTASAFIALLRELSNVRMVSTYYKWNLVANDPDDNKYCDCAIAGNADCLISEDRHFNVLKNISFPKVSLLTIDEFMKVLSN